MFYPEKKKSSKVNNVAGNSTKISKYKFSKNDKIMLGFSCFTCKKSSVATFNASLERREGNIDFSFFKFNIIILETVNFYF